MAAVCPLNGDASVTLKDQAPRVLWVGRITPGKRLEWLLEAARRCPEIGFDIVGTPNQASEYATGLIEAAAQMPNVKAHGRLATDELNKLYRSCRILCCTSTLEGFPTTFLEAWSCGIPVITTFDPDEIVARHGLGRVAQSQEEIVSYLRGLLANASEYARLSQAARTYYSENHTVEAVSKRFQTAFNELVSR
jgi:glycosyltransferase involved in cell wall biosynthesis